MITIRTRNIKLNVFLNEDEQKILKEKSNKAKLSQSGFIRKLIMHYTDDSLSKIDIEHLINSLSIVCNNLINLSNKLNRLQYNELVNFLDKQINDINILIKNI